MMAQDGRALLVIEYCELGCLLNFISEEGMHAGEAHRLFNHVVG